MKSDDAAVYCFRCPEGPLIFSNRTFMYCMS